MFPKSYDMKKEKYLNLKEMQEKKKISEHSLKNHLDSIKNSIINPGEFVFNKTSKYFYKLLLEDAKNSDNGMKNIFISGFKGSGKFHTAKILASSIDSRLPLVFFNGPDIIHEKTENENNLSILSRKAVCITFYQDIRILKGRLIDLKIIQKKKDFKKIYCKISLRSEKIQSVYRISATLLKKMIIKKIKIGDIVNIDIGKGDIYKEKVSDYKNELLILGENIEINKIKEHVISLNELDFLNFNPSRFFEYKAYKSNELSVTKKEKIDQLVVKWSKENKIKIFKGTVFIKNIEYLNSICFSFFKKILDGLLSPSFLCTSDDTMYSSKDLSNYSSGSIPLDFLDRFSIFMVKPFGKSEIRKILINKLLDGNIILENKVLDFLVKICVQCGFDFTLYLTSILINTLNFNASNVKIGDVLRIYDLFVDYRRLVCNPVCILF
jgi:DNA helicase TIP49 (TBP-interacting protein)